MSIEEIEKRREERRAATAKLREEQYAKDIVEVDKLEEEFGPDRVTVMKMNSFVPGLPMLVVVQSPDPSVMTRFRQMVRRAQGKHSDIGNAKDLLASSVVVYPDAATYAKMREQWTSIHDDVGNEAIRLSESEGKG